MGQSFVPSAILHWKKSTEFQRLMVIPVVAASSNTSSLLVVGRLVVCVARQRRQVVRCELKSFENCLKITPLFIWPISV
jgi:hypothetical protein